MTSIWELDTPALLVDLDALEHNASLMAQRCADAGIAWRPHVKACKAPAMALRLLEAGAVGITCAKSSEALVMARGGVTDILIANEVVGEQKVARLVEVAKLATLCVAVDDADNIREISAAADAAGVTIDLLVDIDVNLHRCGVTPEESPALCSLISDLPAVRLRGLMGYEGHVMGLPDDEKERETSASASILARANELCQSDGHQIGVLSGGGSGNYRYVLKQSVLNELQAGGAALMDLTYESMGVGGHRQALSLVCQVVSAANPDRAAGDAGWKATGRHTGLPAVVNPDGWNCVGLSAEHTHFSRDGGEPLRIGDRIEMIPHYSDSTVLLHRTLHAHRAGVVEDTWEISGSGALQ
ncbi:MAG: alanine racemase [Chloroflexota bacterium]|nr:alanine racemase [Chloroflexota bacterium]MDE2894592.1 alanine racemase [Chloroflexota bacterium]